MKRPRKSADIGVTQQMSHLCKIDCRNQQVIARQLLGYLEVMFEIYDSIKKSF